MSKDKNLHEKAFDLAAAFPGETVSVKTENGFFQTQKLIEKNADNLPVSIEALLQMLDFFGRELLEKLGIEPVESEAKSVYENTVFAGLTWNQLDEIAEHIELSQDRVEQALVGQLFLSQCVIEGANSKSISNCESDVIECFWDLLTPDDN